VGLLRDARITRSQVVLPAATQTEHRPPSCAPPTRQPPRRHPPRLPEDPHPLRRADRLGTPHNSRRLTVQEPGMSAADRLSGRVDERTVRPSGRWLHRVAGRVEDNDDRSYQEPRLAHLDDGLNPWRRGRGALPRSRRTTRVSRSAAELLNKIAAMWF
jgi:hypothetical protein